MKIGFRPTLLLTCLVFFLFGVAPGNCQQSLLNSNNADIPDAPSAHLATTCTENNGKPCPEWVHKWVGQYPPPSESANLQLARDPSSVHFWTYRSWQEPPLRTNGQVFRSKVFLAAHIGGAIAVALACHTRNSGEHWGQEIPGVVALFGLDYVQFRYIGGPNAIAAPVYEMIHYGLASAR